MNYRSADGLLHYQLLRRRDQTWHAIPDSLIPALPRGFGHYVAFADTEMKSSVNKRLYPNRPLKGLKGVHDPEVSAGAAEWKTDRRDTGPSLEESMRASEYVYNGRLSLYNIENERVYTIETNQGNSEILLVENETVYYRVNDRLYSAAITEAGLGAPKLLATDAVINDVHWAFLGH